VYPHVRRAAMAAALFSMSVQDDLWLEAGSSKLEEGD
jgi:hypothetical protein